VETSRLEIFADAIFAIAATLLILDVSVHAPGPALGEAVKHAWPEYAAYGVSFLIIGIWWVNHHHCMKLIDQADRAFLFLNIALLACIAFLPFPTELVAQHLRDSGVRTAAITYGLTMTAASICFVSFWFYAASGRRLIAKTVDQSVVTAFSRSTLPGLLIDAAATVVALWSPYTALALFAGTALFYVVGSSLFGRD
jgi:uncharacterized membrane protein